MQIKPLRSALYMPGSNPRVLEKAKSLPADAVVFDLEDAVAPDNKLVARSQACAAAQGGGYGRRQVVIRVNGMDTPWGHDDLAAALKAGPNAVLVPKISSGDEVVSISQAMNEAGAKDTKLWIMMETPLAVLGAGAIAAASAEPGSRLACFVMGTNDLAKDTRARLAPGRSAMVTWLSTCVAAARAYDLSILDGVYNDFTDDDGLAAECRQGLELGMDGKTLIHPRQIPICNEVFSPSAGEVDWARRIVAQFDRPENTAVNVMSIDGKMVERLHADMARRVIALAEAMDEA
jgi:citrate lyase subunit beta/citryl-CoA lyase